MERQQKLNNQFECKVQFHAAKNTIRPFGKLLHRPSLGNGCYKATSILTVHGNYRKPYQPLPISPSIDSPLLIYHPMNSW